MTRTARAALIALVLVPAALIFGGLMHSDAQAGRGVAQADVWQDRQPLAPSVGLSEVVLDEGGAP